MRDKAYEKKSTSATSDNMYEVRTAHTNFTKFTQSTYYRAAQSRERHAQYSYYSEGWADGQYGREVKDVIGEIRYGKEACKRS